MQKISFIIYLFISLFSLIISCARMDTNLIKKSEQVIKGGQSKSTLWKNNLIVKRTSWYYKASLLYEINIAEIPIDSPFINWFDSGEQSSIKPCKQLLWVVDYTYNSKRVQQNYVKDLLSQSGYVDISAPHFQKNFLNHPDTASLSNANYNMKLFCNQSKRFAGIAATLPGFMQENIEF